MKDELDRKITPFKFGSIEFKTRGVGLFYCSDALKARIAELPIADAEQANRAAWKLRRQSDRIASRYSNITMHGWSHYDTASHAAYVAKAICEETFKRMRVKETA